MYESTNSRLNKIEILKMWSRIYRPMPREVLIRFWTWSARLMTDISTGDTSFFDDISNVFGLEEGFSSLLMSVDQFLIKEFYYYHS